MYRISVGSTSLPLASTAELPDVSQTMTIRATISESHLRDLDWSRFEVAGPDDHVGPMQAARDLIESASAEAQRATFRFLQDLTYLHLDERETSDVPYGSEELFASLDHDGLRVLSGLVPASEAPLFRARVLDIAWHYRICDHKAAREAATLFIDGAKALFDPVRWLACYRCLFRAFALSARLDRNAEPFTTAVSVALELINRAGGEDPKYFVDRTTHLLLRHRHIPDDGHVAILEEIVAKALDNHNYHRARDHIETLILVHRRRQDTTAEDATRERLARTTEDHSKFEAQNGNPSVAVAHLEDAIAVWRQIGNVDAELRRLRAELQRLQRKAVESFAKIEGSPLELSDITQAARDLVRGKPAREAIFALATCLVPPSLDALKSEARQSLRESGFLSLIPQRQVTVAGRTAHVRKSLLDCGEDMALVEQAHVHLRLKVQSEAISIILPAADQVQREHGITTLHLLEFAARSSFVPPRREYVVAKGLALGFQGEFVLAAHLLVPQFEAAIRWQLEAAGAVVSTLPASGVQNEKPLGELLDLPEAASLWGADQVFELKSLLTEKVGQNLRNELVHGLLDDGAAHAGLVAVWWKFLSLAVVHLLCDLERANAPDGASKSEAPKGEPTNENDVEADSDAG